MRHRSARWTPEKHAPRAELPPLKLSTLQAAALRCFEKFGSMHPLFGSHERAAEYTLDCFLRAEWLIDPSNQLTGRARASLALFDEPPPPPRYRPPPEEFVFEQPTEEEPEPEEESAHRIIRVVVNNELLAIRLTELDGIWYAETTIPSAKGRRKKKLEIIGKTKAEATHGILAQASAVIARAYVKLNS